MLTLVRYNFNVCYTQGALLSGKDFVCDTLELPWKGNEHEVSCIPEGSYITSYRDDIAFHIRKAFVLHDVPDRTGILIHVANHVEELKGCIAVGTKYGAQLYDSLDSFLKLREIVKETTVLKILDARK